MDNETTKVLNSKQKNQKTETTQTQQKEMKNGTNFMGRASAATVGAAVGVGVIEAAEHIYNKTTDETEDVPAKTGETQAEPETPTTAEAIVETDEGVRVAHVDDSMSFSDVFAAAREQVGAGGVFEWHGKVYGTYYENEWNNMSQEERAEWQSNIDYADVMDKPTETTAHTQTTTHSATHIETASATTATAQATEVTADDPNSVPSDASYIDDSAPAPSSDFESENEVHVVGIAIQDNGHGGMATIAGLQSGEETAIVVDVDTDGTIDIIGIDENQNSQFEQNEWHDASEAHLSTEQIVGAYVEEAHEQGVQAVVTDLGDGSQYQIIESGSGYGLASLENDPSCNMYEASNDIQSDDMPDYMNDADAGIMDA